MMLTFLQGFSQETISSSQLDGIKTIVIDAGHGGHDPGCHGADVNEKTVALAISLKLGKLIEENHPNVKVIYTRTTDVFLELEERAVIANKNKADLFICIHANAASASAYGTETYVMGLDKSNKNLEVAKRENAVMLLEEDYKMKYNGFDPNSDEDLIALTLMQSAYLNNSLLMAAYVQESFKKRERRNRGVKQAPYWVLHRTSMPSVLIETGFLTNREEERYLMNPKNQDQVANDIYTAFKKYKQKLDGKIKISNNKSSTAAEPVKAKKDTIKVVVQSNIKTDSTTIVKEVIKPVVIKDSIIEVIKEENLPDIVLTELVAENNKTPDVLESNIDTISVTKSDTLKVVKENAKEIIKEEVKFSPNDEVLFRVQIKSSSKPIEINATNFSGLTNVWQYQSENGMYKYTVGESSTIGELNYLLTSIRKKGFSDAFIVAFKNGKRIPIQDARKLLGI